MSEISGQAVLQERDELIRFGLGQGHLRGVAISLDDSWQTACANHDYPPAVTALLGECVAAALCMVAMLKFDGRLILQFGAKARCRCWWCRRARIYRSA